MRDKTVTLTKAVGIILMVFAHVIKAYSYQWWWLAYFFVGIVIPLVLYQTILKNIHFTEKITKRIEMHNNLKSR